MATIELKTRVGIIGSGPAGLMLSQLLARQGIESIIVEQRSRSYVEGRIRAGVLEQGTIDAMREAGVSERMDQLGIVHEGFEFEFNGQRHRIDLKGLTGKSVMVYGQTELTHDLMEARVGDGDSVFFEASDVLPTNVQTDHPRLSWRTGETSYSLECDYIAGCDGFYGIARQTIPPSILKSYERAYSFGWLGVLSETPPVADELIYVNHTDGFALCSMRSTTRSRYYIQFATDDELGNWPDDRFWEVLSRRIGESAASNLITGPALEKSITPLRSYVAEPMRYGNLFLAGDAAHIVPPTGAKGLNLAIADVRTLARGLTSFYLNNDPRGLDQYSETCLHRVWKTARFSWYMSGLLHHYPEHTSFDKKMQRTEFDYIASSETGSRSVAENYVGLPMPWEL